MKYATSPFYDPPKIEEPPTLALEDAKVALYAALLQKPHATLTNNEVELMLHLSFEPEIQSRLSRRELS